MKSIDIKSMLIGILLCSCMFLIMGQTSIYDKNPMEVKIVGMEQVNFPSSINVSVKEFPGFSKLFGFRGLKVDLSDTKLEVKKVTY